MAGDITLSNQLCNRLVVISFNMHGFNQGVETIRDLICKVHPDIIALQEHWLTPANLVKLNNISDEYFVYATSAMAECVARGPLAGRPFGGTGFLISNKLAAVTTSIVSVERYTAIRIADWFIISVYLPSVGTADRDLLYADMLNELDSLLSEHAAECNCLIGGDFNVDLSRRSVVSDLVDSFRDRNKLYRCDQLFPVFPAYTFCNESLNVTSPIDYFLTSSRDSVIAFNIVDVDINLSDHLPLLAVCKCESFNGRSAVHSTPYTDDVRYLRWDHAPLEQYYECTRAILQSVLDELNTSTTVLTPGIADAVYDKIVSALRWSADATIPKHRKGFYKFWWTVELNELKAKAVASCRFWGDSGQPRHGYIYDMYKRDKLLYKKQLRAEQTRETEYFSNDLHEALERKSGCDFWRTWKSKFDNNSSRRVFVNGLSDNKTVAALFADHFRKVCAPHSDRRNEELRSVYVDMRQSYEGDVFDCDTNGPFDVQLLSEMIAKMKRGKAAGFDELSAEHLKYCHPVVVILLCKLFNFYLSNGHLPASFGISYTVPIPKVDSNCRQLTADDFRGISISPVISKLFELAILQRFAPLFETSDCQFGFKRSLSCSHAIYTVRNVIDYYTSQGSTVNVCSIDLSKAFDRMNHSALFIKLMKRRFPVALLLVLEKWFAFSVTCVRWYDCFSEFFKMSAGVRQGGVLSPFLFAIFIDDIVQKVRSVNAGCFVSNISMSIFLYADDILLLAPSVIGLQKLLAACEEELIFLDMKINEKKSVCIRFGNRFNVSCAPIVTGSGHALDWVQTTRYLGVFFVSARSFRCSFSQARVKFYKAFNAIFGKVGRFATENVVIRLVALKCLPVLLYGSDACPVLTRDLHSLTFAVTRVMMKVFNTRSREVVDDCMIMFGIMPVIHQLYLRKVKFLLRFVNASNILCSVFTDNVNVELSGICDRFSADLCNICDSIRQSAFSR